MYIKLPSLINLVISYRVIKDPCLTLSLLAAPLSSTDNLCKWFEPTESQFLLFDTLIVDDNKACKVERQVVGVVSGLQLLMAGGEFAMAWSLTNKLTKKKIYDS